MKAHATRTLVALFLSCAAAGAGAAPAVRTGAAAWGMPAPDDAAARTVVLDDGARYVNVADGETVRLVHGAHSFTWTFDTVGRDGVVALERIAPRDFGLAGARVYVAPNPLYDNG